jgi:hypothetical protein
MVLAKQGTQKLLCWTFRDAIAVAEQPLAPSGIILHKFLVIVY